MATMGKNGLVDIHIRPGSKNDIPEIIKVTSSSILPGEDIGFGGGVSSPVEAAKLSSLWRAPNKVEGREILVAELDGHIVCVAEIEDRGQDLELVDIDVPMEMQGRGIGRAMVRSIEDRARREGKHAVTLGTSRNVQGVAWKSLPWWQHLGYHITHEEENEWTRSIGKGAREIRMRKDLDT